MLQVCLSLHPLHWQEQRVPGREEVLRLRAPAEVGLAGGLGLVHAADPRVMRGAADEIAVLLGLSGDGPHGGDELVQRLLALRLVIRDVVDSME